MKEKFSVEQVQIKTPAAWFSGEHKPAYSVP